MDYKILLGVIKSYTCDQLVSFGFPLLLYNSGSGSDGLRDRAIALVLLCFAVCLEKTV